MKEELRKKIQGAMKRPSNPNKTAASVASVMGAVAGISKNKIQRFIEGDDEALTEAECRQIDALA